MKQKYNYSIWKRKGYLWVTLFIFLISAILHWYFVWEVFKSEQLAHSEPVVVSEYIKEMMCDTMENWQSGFLQLMWQVAGLAFLWHVGSPNQKKVMIEGRETGLYYQTTGP